MTDYLRILQRASQRTKEYSEEWNKKFETYYEDLSENLSYEDLSRVNNMFILLTGISLETLFDSEVVEELVNDGYYELLERIGE